MAINDDDLLTWSPDYAKASVCEWDYRPAPEDAVLDEAERDRLTAYSLYRMMRLRVTMGELGNAEVLYNRLVAKYTNSAGDIYVRLATAFWEEYQSSGDPEAGRLAAATFAADHRRDVCNPLANYYDFGVVVAFYFSEDVCLDPWK